MRKKYVLQIQDADPYPFNGARSGDFTYIVQLTLSKSEKKRQAQTQIIAALLLSLDHPHLMQVLEVRERKNGGFTLYYEYHGESLKSNGKLNDAVFVNRVKAKLANLADLLSQKCIRAELKIDDIGINQAGEPIYFLRPSFQVIKKSQQKQLRIDYQSQIQGLFQCSLNLRETIKSVSDYSWHLDKKLTDIEKRINKLRRTGGNRRIDSNSLKNADDRNKTSSDDSSNQKDRSKNRSQKVRAQNNIVLKHLTQKQGNGTQKLTNSFVGLDSSKMMAKTKFHKSSFGDYSTTSHYLNQELGKQRTLKTRVSTALQKTQQAFKFYEKYYKRRGSRI